MIGKTVLTWDGDVEVDISACRQAQADQEDQSRTDDDLHLTELVSLVMFERSSFIDLLRGSQVKI